MLFLTIAVVTLLFTVGKSVLRRRAVRRQAEAGLRHAALLDRPAVAEQFGLVPNGGLVLGHTTLDDSARAALDAAGHGDWRPAAGYVEAAGRDWDERYDRIELLVSLAGRDDAWLNAWRLERPESSDAAAIQTAALVHAGWRIRGGGYSNTVTDEMAQGFRAKLAEARATGAEAVRLAPADDPSPFLSQLALARGQNWTNDEFRALWAEVFARAPQHWDGHWQAMQYWCRKWHGSHELMHAFVDGAIAAAPAGSLLTLYRLDAYTEQYDDAATRTGPELRAAVDALLADLAVARPDHPKAAAARGWAVRFLVGQGRYPEALAQLRALGPVIPRPFLDGEDGPDEFVALRGTVVAALGGAR
ncbi:hypothetical protein ACIRBX_28315 [Kitasatospora sp. NPDC096147]|uniref:hypothetical protein n=1 Tax=Kitasatospora sp. NPDC096147 TaxID=3364093 RepID=UPI0037FE30A1